MDDRYGGEKVFVFTGPLTAYPIDEGAYDWAIKHGFFSPSKPDHASPEFIGWFSAAQQEHHHYESGNRVSDF